MRDSEELRVFVGASLLEQVKSGVKVKLGPAEQLKVEHVRDILSTLNAVNALDYRATSLTVGNTTYPLADYKLGAAFRPFLLPRRVAVSADRHAINLARKVVYCWKEFIPTDKDKSYAQSDIDAVELMKGKVLTPYEFIEAQQGINELFKKDFHGESSLEDEESKLISDLPVVACGDKVHEGNSSNTPVIPVFLVEGIYDEGYFTVDLADYLREALFGVRQTLRSTQ
jgi:hypothetical protein